MKKWIAIILTLVLALGTVACTEAGDATVQEGFDGVWYNSAGRKLELKNDGTYLLADEVEGGKWEKKSEIEAECTDVYGTFSATYAKDESGESLVFGPYGTFRRATEEQVARYESALCKPILSITTGTDYSLATWHLDSPASRENAAIINGEGLVLATLDTMIAGSAILYDEVLLWISENRNQGWVINRNTGAVLASGSPLSNTDEHIALRSKRTTANGETDCYIVLNRKGEVAVDWTPIPTVLDNGHEYVPLDKNASGIGGVLVGSYPSCYYILNPLTGKTFRVENARSIHTTEGTFFERQNVDTPCAVASDWTSPAQPIEYEGFYMSEDGTPVECQTPYSPETIATEHYFLDFPYKQKNPVLRNRATGESVILNCSISPYGGTIKINGNYGCGTYCGTAKDGRKGTFAVVFDMQGNILYDDVLVDEDMNSHPSVYLTKNGVLATKAENGKIRVYNEKGEEIYSGEKAPGWLYDKPYFDSEKGVMDPSGRVLIPHITFLPAEMK